MAKTKRTPLERIQKGKSKDIAIAFFLSYFTPSFVTQALYKKTCEMREGKKNKIYVLPIIYNYLSEWKKEGFIESLNMRTPIEKKGHKKYTIKGKGYRLNLEPLYRYYKEEHNIEFTKPEKEWVDYLFMLPSQRHLVLTEYPKDDIINAVIKFYIKHYIMSFGELYTIENISKSSKKVFKKDYRKLLLRLIEKADKMNKKIKRSSKYDCVNDLEETRKEFKDNKLAYLMKYKQNPKFISKINAKFMRVLGIEPNY